MAVIEWPDDILLRPQVVCVLCTQERPIYEVTVGLHDASGSQTFACNQHFWDRRKFIVGWADFIAARGQYEALEQAGIEVVLSEGSDERPIH